MQRQDLVRCRHLRSKFEAGLQLFDVQWNRTYTLYTQDTL